jgi:hypothetical protein
MGIAAKNMEARQGLRSDNPRLILLDAHHPADVQAESHVVVSKPDWTSSKPARHSAPAADPPVGVELPSTRENGNETGEEHRQD